MIAKLKKITAVCLALTLLAMFSACSQGGVATGNNEEDTPTPSGEENTASFSLSEATIGTVIESECSVDFTLSKPFSGELTASAKVSQNNSKTATKKDLEATVSMQSDTKGTINVKAAKEWELKEGDVYEVMLLADGKSCGSFNVTAKAAAAASYEKFAGQNEDLIELTEIIIDKNANETERRSLKGNDVYLDILKGYDTKIAVSAAQGISELKVDTRYNDCAVNISNTGGESSFVISLPSEIKPENIAGETGIMISCSVNGQKVEKFLSVHLLIPHSLSYNLTGKPFDGTQSVRYFEPQDTKLNIDEKASQYYKHVIIRASADSSDILEVDKRTLGSDTVYRFMALENVEKPARYEVVFFLGSGLFKKYTYGVNTQKAYMHQKPGLYVENGVLKRNGKEYRAVGANYFAATYYSFENKYDTAYVENFRVLRDYEIPYVRVSLSGFGHNHLYMYKTNKEEYFARIDPVIKEAERNGVGIIASLFWTGEVMSDIAGEPFSYVGKPDSKTWEFMESLIRDVITRYKDSPAIWGWEYGNEFNLYENLPDPENFFPPIWPKSERQKRDSEDIITDQVITAAYSNFAKVVRKYDPYRIISTGAAQPRGSAWHMKYEPERPWTADDEEQFKEVLAWQNPNPVDTISVHIYGEEQDRAEPLNTYSGIIKAMMSQAKATGKVLFIGEFGYPDDSTQFPLDAKTMFTKLLGEIEAQKVPLAAVWNFYLTHDNNFEIDPRRLPKRAYQLEMIRDLNRKIKAELK